MGRWKEWGPVRPTRRRMFKRRWRREVELPQNRLPEARTRAFGARKGTGAPTTDGMDELSAESASMACVTARSPWAAASAVSQPSRARRSSGGAMGAGEARGRRLTVPLRPGGGLGGGWGRGTLPRTGGEIRGAGECRQGAGGAREVGHSAPGTLGLSGSFWTLVRALSTALYAALFGLASQTRSWHGGVVWKVLGVGWPE